VIYAISYRKLPVFKVVLVHWYTSGPALLCLLYRKKDRTCYVARLSTC